MVNDLNQIAPTAAASAPATALIYDDWYPALRSDRLRGKRLTTAMLLGIPLSCGWFDGARVKCKYHGWAFEAGSGQCREIPSLTSEDAAEINAKTETLHTAFHKVSEAMYQRAQEQAAASSPDGGANGAGAETNGAGAEEDVVDAEVVDEK